MKAKFIFLTTLTIYLIGCKKDNNIVAGVCSKKSNKIEFVKTHIVGTYDWDYSKFFPDYGEIQTWTPANKGMTRRYVLGSDGNSKYYENGVLKLDENYEVNYEFKVSTYPLDSFAMVIFYDKTTGQRTHFFRPYLCEDSARFYNPYSSLDIQEYFGKR